MRDVGSLNGTYVNRQRIDEATLHTGDEVQIGKFRLVFYAGTGDDRVSPERVARESRLRAAMTIGAVLAQLQPDFPDVTISKIRFLEAEGLVTPSRTGSGYRTFSGEDLERLRYILTAQRDRFWPLKVIRDALDALDRGLQPAGPQEAPSRPTVPPADVDPALPTAGDLTRASSLRLTARRAARGGRARRDHLHRAGPPSGCCVPTPRATTASAALAVARAAGALAAYGVEPRHLRPFRTAADREIGLVQQVTSPMRGRGTAGRAAAGEDPTPQLLALCIALHASLVRAGLDHG